MSVFFTRLSTVYGIDIDIDIEDLFTVEYNNITT